MTLHQTTWHHWRISPPFHSHCRWLQETTIDSGISVRLMQTSDPRINEQVGGKTDRKLPCWKIQSTRVRQSEKRRYGMNSVHRGIRSGETVPTSPWLFSSPLGLCGFLSIFFFFFFLDSQTPWKRKPSERMMRTEGHCGFKHTYGHSPICLPHNLLCWQTKQS